MEHLLSGAEFLGKKTLEGKFSILVLLFAVSAIGDTGCRASLLLGD